MRAIHGLSDIKGAASEMSQGARDNVAESGYPACGSTRMATVGDHSGEGSVANAIRTMNHEYCTVNWSAWFRVKPSLHMFLVKWSPLCANAEYLCNANKGR